MASLFEPANCTVAPEFGRTDAGVAGAGVLLSSIITATLSLLLSASIIFSERLTKSRPSASTIRRKLLSGYSDQQIAVGIGIQSVGLAKMQTILPYHFFIIWMLSLLSTATHNATLLALVRDFRRDWVLRWMRQFLMAVNLVLSCVFGVFVLMGVAKGLGTSTLPVACVLRPDADLPVDSQGDNVGLAFAGTIAVVAGNLLVFVMGTWYLHSRSQRWYKIVQIAGVILMTSIAVGASARMILLSQAFGTPSVPLIDEGEKEWSFGQLLSLLMLLWPLVGTLEMWRGEVSCKPPVEDEKAVTLGGRAVGAGSEVELGTGMGDWQPNPLWGSKTSTGISRRK